MLRRAVRAAARGTGYRGLLVRRLLYPPARYGLAERCFNARLDLYRQRFRLGDALEAVEAAGEHKGRSFTI